ncbi:hypothetical protein MDAP_001183 [Mitosporidium daphniae]
MHRPEFIDHSRASSTQASLNEHSVGSIVSLNTLLASGNASRISSLGESTITSTESSSLIASSIDALDSSLEPVAQAYNASFQGLSASSSPSLDQTPEPGNGTDGEILRMLNLTGSPPSHSSDVSNVFHFWRSFLDSSPAALRNGTNGSQSEFRSVQRVHPSKNSRVEEAKRKHVYQLACEKCESVVSDRAMRSKLLADSNCILFSTDSPMRYV